MKCAQCGYHNMPGAALCGRCGASLAATAGAAAAAKPKPPPEEGFYPPRARERTFAQNARLRMSLPDSIGGRLPAASIGRSGMKAWRERIRASRGDAPHSDWFTVYCAPLPGLVQWVQNRRRVAAVFFAATIVCAIGGVVNIHREASDWFLWLIGALALASIGDACWAAIRESSTAPAHLHQKRALLLALQSVCGAGFGVASTLIFVSQSYPAYLMQSDVGAPEFRDGDGLLVRSWANPGREGRRGDIALINLGDYYPVTERLIGFPRDAVAYDGRELWVNNQKLSGARLPLEFRPGLAPFQVVVPKDRYLIWATVAGRYNPGGAEGPAFQAAGLPYLLANSEEIRGRVIAVYTPPAHRRWIRE